MPNLFATHVALLSVANIGVWGGTGFNMIVMYTALRAVPSELYDAARIDGASQLQVALRIKIPMIAPALVLTGVFSLIATLQVFNEPQTLSPLTNTISPVWMPLMRVYDLAFNNNNSYEAAALSVIIAAVMFVGLVLPAPGEQQARLPGTVSRDGTDANRRRAHRGAVRRRPGRAGGRRPGAERRTAVLPTAILLLGAVYCLLPVAWVLIASTKNNAQLFNTFTLAPNGSLWSNIRDLSSYAGGVFWHWMLNTALYAGGGALRPPRCPR